MMDRSWTWWDATTHVSSQSVHREARYGISNIFQHGGRPLFWVLKMLIFDHVTVIVFLICWCEPNFIKIGSRVRPPDAHDCWMFNAPLLGNDCWYGNRIMVDMLGTWWDATTQVSSQWAHWLASYGIFNIFQHGRRSSFWILKIVIFDHVTVIAVLICCCISNFIKIGSGSRRTWLLNV